MIRIFSPDHSQLTCGTILDSAGSCATDLMVLRETEGQRILRAQRCQGRFRISDVEHVAVTQQFLKWYVVHLAIIYVDIFQTQVKNAPTPGVNLERR